MERAFNEENKLFQCVTDMLNGVSGGELEAVFRDLAIGISGILKGKSEIFEFLDDWYQTVVKNR
jgi:hypothetical protein